MKSIILFFHICAGSVAILSGFGALVPRKGSSLHMLLGKAFFYSMITMAGAGIVLASFYSFELINAAIGVFTIYLVLSSRWTINNTSGHVTNKEKIGAFASVSLFILFTVLSINAYKSGQAAIDGVYVEAFYVYTVLAALAVVLDLKVLWFKGVFGAHRIVRHLWRMTLALFIATASLFLGQEHVFPEFIQESGVLGVPVLISVIALFFWVIRVFVGRRFRKSRKEEKELATVLPSRF